MAFTRASGYNNLSQGNTFPVIYSKRVQLYFRKVSVVEAITNSEYFGEIANFGDTVRIIKEPTISVSDYVRGQQLLSQDLDDDQLTLTVDQAKYFQFQVDDIEEKQSHVNWMDLSASAGAYALKDSYDTAILQYMEDNLSSSSPNMIYGTTGSPLDLGHSAGEVTPLTVMNRLSRLLDEQNVPTDNRWFVAGPLFWEQMADENSKLIDVEFTGDSSSILRNGMVTKGLIRNFRCYKSNNVPSSSTTWYGAYAGHMSAVATANALTKSETFRSQNTFADIYRSLHVYGRKLLRSNALAASHYAVD